ncbi:MAG: hypothetical protein LLG14_04225 [Nocardiaceae bacterium]|nr:hypothetical protein [Nocardiaceae bacterium]
MLDEETRLLRAQAAARAEVEATVAERARLDGLIRDNVLAALHAGGIGTEDSRTVQSAVALAFDVLRRGVASSVKSSPRALAPWRLPPTAVGRRHSCASATICSAIRYLDKAALPLLEQLATEADTDESTRGRAILVEARLRDRILARSLASERVLDPAEAARARGVEVSLLDEGALDDATDDVRSKVHSAILDHLNATRHGGSPRDFCRPVATRSARSSAATATRTISPKSGHQPSTERRSP